MRPIRLPNIRSLRNWAQTARHAPNACDLEIGAIWCSTGNGKYFNTYLLTNNITRKRVLISALPKGVFYLIPQQKIFAVQYKNTLQAQVFCLCKGAGWYFLLHVTQGNTVWKKLTQNWFLYFVIQVTNITFGMGIDLIEKLLFLCGFRLKTSLLSLW